MNPLYYRLVLAVAAAVVGEVLALGIVPAEFVGLAASVSVFLSGLVRPPAAKGDAK